MEHNEDTFKINFKKNQLVLIQASGVENYKLMQSDISASNFRGMITEGYGKAINGKSMIYNTKTKLKPEVLTVLQVKNENYEEKDIKVISKESTYEIYLNDNLYLEITKY